MLTGIKIIDFTRLLPGPLGTHLLSQMGAEVIKIESPKRIDYARSSGPQVDGASILFHQINHLKQIKNIDYSTEKGKKEVFDLIQSADVLIEQFRPGAMTSWGLGYEDIQKINPNIIYVSVTGYGQEGKYAPAAGHDINYMAYAGILGLIKDHDGKPVVPDVQFADIGGAYMMVMATQAALIRRFQTGKGAKVDVSLCDAMLPFLAVPYALHSGGMNPDMFNLLNGKTAANYTVYECADGKWLSLGALELKFWNLLCDILEKPDWKRQNALQLMNMQFPRQEVETLFKTRNREYWIDLFAGHDVCVAPVLAIDELEASDYHQQKQTFSSFETPGGKVLKAPELPFQIS